MGRVGLLDKERIVITEDFKEWQWFNASKVLSVYLYLLLHANTKALFKGKDRIKRGAIATTTEIIADTCGITKQNVRNALASLEQAGEISRERRNRYQIITVTNYEQYKDDI